MVPGPRLDHEGITAGRNPGPSALSEGPRRRDVGRRRKAGASAVRQPRLGFRVDRLEERQE